MVHFFDFGNQNNFLHEMNPQSYDSSNLNGSNVAGLSTLFANGSQRSIPNWNGITNTTTASAMGQTIPDSQSVSELPSFGSNGFYVWK